ncbi:hypothetical protein HO173_000280 [Letharia columbiana]|uniref:DUF2423 domain-containing protein n=1 Tax=Letharia columbiana TaxID=112416 RepID=A0A8H6G705_9LECA|nr:uncharacterized protein HO173_000280 [Letharia columbiana]KAF6241569.1 hypothetical protein HO173_000280 [Letharia columbiana]
MAKGLRSSRNKANKSKLRSNVFGPAESARKERLSAKLIELASKIQSNPEEDLKMVDREKVTEQEIAKEPEAHVPASEEEMDNDQAKQPSSTTELVSRSTSRVQKRGRGKARASMVFPIYKKGKRVGPRLSARDRKKSLRP